VQKAINSVNKVMARQSNGFYSANRYAQAAFTNVSHRLEKALVTQQLTMFVKAMSLYGVDTGLYNALTFWW
jgi:hypothetical protein